MVEQSITSGRAVDEQSRRLIREGLLTNILVEAGAGSGKTQMLAERMAAGVAEGVYQVEHMAAVTFTRKAASELRGRFHLALEMKLRDLRAGGETGKPSTRADANVAAIARVDAAVSNLERFFAGTIHAFCARLLRERPVESGVSPGFTELNEQQDLDLRKRVWRDFVTITRSAGNANMLALLDADIRPKDLDAAFATICVNEDVEFPGGDASAPDPRPALKALDAFWRQLERHLPAHIAETTSCKIQQAALEFRGQRNVDRHRLDQPSVVAALLATWGGDWTITQKCWADSAADKKRFKELINPLHEAFRTSTVSPYLSQWRQYVYRLAVALLTGARKHAEQERRRLNSLNYGDLLMRTATVLRENGEVRRSLQGKYRHLFVDEFQDTDPVQAEIIFLLASADTTAADWRHLPLRPGALFVVGDPKQSIYRFRRADIEIYNIVRARFSDPATGRVLTLTRNFRSVPALCLWANGVFAQQFPAEPNAHSPRFAALDPHDDGKKATAPGGGVCTLTYASSGEALLHEDADRIARYIRSEVDTKRRRFSDFLILTRKKNTRITPYAEALEALNIPIEVSGAGAFGASKEVQALTALLRALSDPQDAVALVAVLRGPLFGVSDRELFAYTQSGGWFNLFAGIDDQPPRHDAVGRALVALRQFYRWTRVLPAAAALDRVLEHTGHLALAATTPGGVEAGDLLHAVDRVRQVVEEGGSLADAVEALLDDGEERNEVESLPLEPGRTDVVRVMNLHKAKGLEATVVFLADPGGGFAPRVDVRIARTEGAAQGWFKLERKSQDSHAKPLLGEPPDWPQHEAVEAPYLAAEANRLLYVAATRAREMLVISRSTASSGRSPAWGVLNDFLADATELSVPSAVKVPRVRPLDCSPAAQARSETARAAGHARLREASWLVTSVTAEARHIARMTRSADATADDPTRVVRTDTPAHRADAGVAWGTLIHGLLEHAMRHKTASRDDLRRLAMWLTVEEPHLRAVIDEAIDTVQRAARADFWQRAQSREQSVESPFVVAEGRGLTNGVIDLLYKDDGGWQVVDYKTDVALAEGAYAAQLEAYRAALRALGCDVVDASIVSVRAQDV